MLVYNITARVFRSTQQVFVGSCLVAGQHIKQQTPQAEQQFFPAANTSLRHASTKADQSSILTQPPPQASSTTMKLRMRGLPFEASEQDVREFFQGYSLQDVVMRKNASGRFKGEAYVQLDPTAAQQALQLLNGKYMGQRYIELFALEPDQSSAPARPAPQPSTQPSHQPPPQAQLQAATLRNLRLRGLPYEASEQDVREFLKGYTLKVVFVCRNRRGRASGEAYVQLEASAAQQALQSLNGQHMGQRYIELFDEGAAAESTPPAQQPQAPAQLCLRGLPFEASEQDVREFFKGYTLQAVVMCKVKGRPAGEAYVQLEASAAQQALQSLNGQHMGQRYIELCDVGAEADTGPTTTTSAAAAAVPSGTPSTRLRLRGLPYEASEQDVREFFKGYELLDVVVRRTKLGRSTGEAYVQLDPEAAQQALQSLYGQYMGQRYIELFEA